MQKKFKEIEKTNNEIDYRGGLICVHKNGRVYDFIDFKELDDFAENILYGDMSIKEAKNKQDEMKSLMTSLSDDNAQRKDKIESKKETFDTAQMFFDGRNDAISAFEKGILSFF